MTVYNAASYASVQAAQNALQSGGGGRLYLPNKFNLSSSLVVSQAVPTLISGDGAPSGLNFNNASGNANLLQVGNATYNGDFALKDCKLTNDAISGTRPPFVTGVILVRAGAPCFDSITLEGFDTGFWLNETWAQKLNRVKFGGITRVCIGLNDITPANNLTVNECFAFSVQGTVIELGRGCNGLYVINGDFEDIDDFVVFQPLAGGLPQCNTLLIENNDIEGMTGELITKPSNMRLSEVYVNYNTFANCTFTLADIDGGRFEGNTLYNTSVTIDQTNNTNFSVGTNILLGTSSITII